MRPDDYAGMASVLPHQAARTPNATAIVFEGREVGYAELADRVERVGRKLVALGVPRGARVGLLAKNSVDYLSIMFGVVAAGMVTTTINWRLAPEEVAFIVDDADMPFVFVGAEFEGLLSVARSRREFGVHVYSGEIDDAWLDAPEATLEPMANDEAVVLQMYTSGTTGRPKGAMLANRNYRKFLDLDTDRFQPWWQCHPSDTSLIALPLFHIGGLEAVFRVFFSGARMLLTREFDPGEVVELIDRYHPTILSLVPTALLMVIRHPRAKEVDFGCIRSFFYGAAPIAADLLGEALQVMNCGFVQCYGLTEGMSSVAALPPEAHHPDGTPKMRAAGIPLPGVEAKIVDGDGATLPADRVGELCIRTAQVMKGYWNRPEATAETIDADGWLHTGDAATIDEDGYIFIRDRVKDMIISGGENIYPAEVESAVFGHPAVGEVAVIGVPDEKWGESVKAVIVPMPGASIDEAEIIAFARGRIAGYKAPRTVSVVAELPKNATGKVLKTELRRMFASEAAC